MDEERLWCALEEAPVHALMELALVAARTYDAAENPGDQGTMAALAEWFPRLREALDKAGLLQ